MILTDTSVWVDHLRKSSQELSTLLNEGLIVCHPFVIGELSCSQPFKIFLVFVPRLGTECIAADATAKCPELHLNPAHPITTEVEAAHKGRISAAPAFQL